MFRKNRENARAVRQEYVRTRHTNWKLLGWQLEDLQDELTPPPSKAQKVPPKPQSEALSQKIFIARRPEEYGELGAMAFALSRSTEVGGPIEVASPATQHLTVLRSRNPAPTSFTHLNAENIADRLHDKVPKLFKPVLARTHAVGLYGSAEIPTVALVCQPRTLDPERQAAIDVFATISGEQALARRQWKPHVSLARNYPRSQAEAIARVIGPHIPIELRFEPAEIWVDDVLVD